jgi:hypothetical protein
VVEGCACFRLVGMHPALEQNLPGFNQYKTLIALWIGINDINDSAEYAGVAFGLGLLFAWFPGVRSSGGRFMNR